MSGLRRRLSTLYRQAEERVNAAEAQVQHASERRLAELMKLPPRRRLAQIEDPTLTSSDRLKLRRSIAGNLRHRKRYALLFGSRLVVGKLRGLFRYLPRAAAVAAVLLPLLITVEMARSNTDEIIILPQPIELNWRLPSGDMDPKVMPAGAHLAIARQSGSSAIARRWIEGQGYATAPVKIVGRRD